MVGSVMPQKLPNNLLEAQQQTNVTKIDLSSILRVLKFYL